jgi:hypothetical protein
VLIKGRRKTENQKDLAIQKEKSEGGAEPRLVKLLPYSNGIVVPEILTV